MNVPGFNGKLLGRRNFDDFFSTEVGVFGGGTCSPSFEIGKINVGMEIGDEID